MHVPRYLISIRCAAAAGALLLATAQILSAAEPQVVVLVRHAEKAAAPPADVQLSAAGRARAKGLAAALADAGVETIITTQFRRTRETAEPLATKLGITPRVLDAAADATAHAQAVADAVRAGGHVVLVVGHSNTVPQIIKALGGPDLSDLCETSFAHFFTLVLAPDQPARLIRSTYGAPDPAPAPGCGL
jgi:phosphohistidine phosphatase SixA